MNLVAVLTIDEGAEIYIHSGSGIWVRGGTINIEGTLANKVVIQGDRLDGSYPEQPSQWGLEIPLEYQLDGENVYVTVSRGGIWLDRAKIATFESHHFKKWHNWYVGR